jgi:hypothetical protein
LGFSGKFSCHSFTPASIRQNAPPLPGIYALSNAREWVFIAEANDVQAALRAHLSAPGTRLRTAGPTGFTVELCDGPARRERVARLILDLSPSCNDPAQP